MSDDKPVFDNAFQALLIHELQRIANAQEGMLAIAAEARMERLELANKMKKHFTTGFQGRDDGSAGTTPNK